MGYDLRARNKGVNTYSMGSFSWSWMMDNGVGMVVGYGKGIEPASYLFNERKDGKDLMYNDGGKVTAKEAKEMAKVARRLADYQDMLYNQFESMDDRKKQEYKLNENRHYNLPVRRDFVEKIRGFAEFAEKSGGFQVY